MGIFSKLLASAPDNENKPPTGMKRTPTIMTEHHSLESKPIMQAAAALRADSSTWGRINYIRISSGNELFMASMDGRQ